MDFLVHDVNFAQCHRRTAASGCAGSSGSSSVFLYLATVSLLSLFATCKKVKECFMPKEISRCQTVPTPPLDSEFVCLCFYQNIMDVKKVDPCAFQVYIVMTLDLTYTCETITTNQYCKCAGNFQSLVLLNSWKNT